MLVFGGPWLHASHNNLRCRYLLCMRPVRRLAAYQSRAMHALRSVEYPRCLVI